MISSRTRWRERARRLIMAVLGRVQMKLRRRHRVIRKGAEEYELLCAKCGAVAMRFHTKPTRCPTIAPDGLKIRGITGEAQRGVPLGKVLFPLLAQGDIGVAQYFLKEFNGTGLDAYCPDCDEVFCRSHYEPDVHFDDTFYDYTDGICPAGHRRMVDD